MKETHPFKRWLEAQQKSHGLPLPPLPGNAIWAERDTQKNLPGMNARTFNVGPPVPESSHAPGPSVKAVDGSMPETLPPTFERQWRSPLVQQREQNPAVVIMPWPALITNVAGVANVVRAITVPKGAVLFSVSSGAGTASLSTFVSNKRFVLPLAPVTDDLDDNLANTLGPMVNPPNNVWWNCEGMTQLFVGANVTTTNISISFWTGYQPRVPDTAPGVLPPFAQPMGGDKKA